MGKKLNIEYAERIKQLPPYLFAAIDAKKAEVQAQGVDVIDLGVGDPDMPTPAHIVQSLQFAATKGENHQYPSYVGMPSYRQAVVDWFARRFEITFDPAAEVVSLIGSKEGIAHMPLAFVDPGDYVLVPDPGYPVYAIATSFAGGVPYMMPLKAENGFLPDLDAIPEAVAEKSKLMFINYPNNPTGAVADWDFYLKVVDFAARHNIIVCHDAAYTEMAYDGYKPLSFLEIPGAGEVGVEFHSLSKTYNMTGWRIGMAVGNPQVIDALFRFKSNLDSGIPQAIQCAAIEALTGSQDSIVQRNLIYQKRRDKLVYALNEAGLEAKPPRASFYIWAKVPSPLSSEEFAGRLLDDIGVVVTPGKGYGVCGEGYVRLSLTIPDGELDEGIDRIRTWHL